MATGAIERAVDGVKGVAGLALATARPTSPRAVVSLVQPIESTVEEVLFGNPGYVRRLLTVRIHIVPAESDDAWRGVAQAVSAITTALRSNPTLDSGGGSVAQDTTIGTVRYSDIENDTPGGSIDVLVQVTHGDIDDSIIPGM